MERAHAVLHVKAADGPTRRISGIATTPTPDRAGDVLDPLGATFTNPLPLLWHHDKERPIGIVTLHAPTAAGITFDAVIPTIDDPGPLRDRVDEAYQTIRAGLITGVSVGYRVLSGGMQLRRDGSRRVTKSEICEVSLVTVPANMDATIQVIKSLDAEYLRNTGATAPRPSGVPDPSPVRARKGAPTMTAQEQVTQFENSRAAKVAAMSKIMADAGDATLPEDQQQTYDDLALEVKGIDQHLTRARELARLMAGSAAPVADPVAPGRPTVVHVKSNHAPGTAFTRAAMAILATKSAYEAVEYAKRWERDTPEVGLYLKAAVAAGNTTDPAWAGALVTVQNVTSEFIALLRPKTIVGQIPGLREVPFNASVPKQTAGGSYGWVGQGLAKPVTSLAFGSEKLEVSKAAGIVVLTEELVRLSNPSAERLVRDDMIAGIAQFLNQQFIDPSVAYVANVHPASITNGIVGVASTQDPLEDLYALLSAFSAANVPLAGAVLIMSETNALAMGAQRDMTGARTFPGVTAKGGSAEGITLVTTNAAGTNVILLHPPAVLVADEGGVSIDVSREASVQMDSAPAVPDATTVMVSLWQNNLVGLRAERFINWKRVINAGVGLVTGATYPVTRAVAGPASSR